MIYSHRFPRAVWLTRAGQQEFVQAAPNPIGLHCFRTQQEAIASAVGNSAVVSLNKAGLTRYLDSLASRPAAATGAAAESVRPAATPGTGGGNYIIGIDSWDHHFGGSSLTWYGTWKCSPTLGYVVANIGAAWNDKVSSARNFAYSNCRNWDHLPEVNLRANATWGGWKNCGYGFGNGLECYEMGKMNDKTSSEQWSYN